MKITQSEEVMQMIIPVVIMQMEEPEFLGFQDTIKHINSGSSLNEKESKLLKGMEASFANFLKGSGEKLTIKK